MADSIDLSKLRELTPEARTRIEEALKKTLETELAGIAVAETADVAAAHSRSRGPAFSRSRTASADRETDPIESLIAKDLQKMDEASFKQLADRLATLKGIKKGGS